MIIKILIAIIVILSAFGAVQYISKKSIEADNHNKEMAIKAYEEMIKVVPFNRLVDERIDNANDEINATLSNDNSVGDGIYRL